MKRTTKEFYQEMDTPRKGLEGSAQSVCDKVRGKDASQVAIAYARSAVKGFGPAGFNERGQDRALDRASRCGCCDVKLIE
ncbi:MAG: hypothetical protein MN733_10785 [Nitrososphaera sp.]|nr:hypothetical protein [Nitrososphaera sp.]